MSINKFVNVMFFVCGVSGYRYAVADRRGLEGRTPPRGPNYFNFMHSLGKFGKILC